LEAVSISSICVPYTGSLASYQKAVASYSDASMRRYVARPCCTRVGGGAFCLVHHRLGIVQRSGHAPGQCAYCGVPSQSLDYVWPPGWRERTEPSPVLAVSACGECAGVLRDSDAPTPRERRSEVHAHLAKRYRKILSARHLRREDLEEYGDVLRSSMEIRVVEREYALARLAWPLDPDYDARAHVAARSIDDRPREASARTPREGSYEAAHRRVARERGRASGHLCADCGAPAVDWSYNHSGVMERRDRASLMSYSLDVRQYDARCRPCHRAYDSVAYAVDVPGSRVDLRPGPGPLGLRPGPLFP
jgi:hypothetical protein